MKNFQVFKPGQNVPGPFNGYELGSIGSILNLLVRQEGIRLDLVERVQVGNGKITLDGKQVSSFKVVENTEGSSVYFHHEGEWSTYNDNQIFTDESGIRRMLFHPAFDIGHDSVCVRFTDEIATPELHRFMSYVLGSNMMNQKTYHLGKKAIHFFQGGSHDPDGQFILIEFWGYPQAIKEWCDWCTKNYRVGVKLDDYLEELFEANKVERVEPRRHPIGSLVEIIRDEEPFDRVGCRLFVVGYDNGEHHRLSFSKDAEEAALGYESAIKTQKGISVDLADSLIVLTKGNILRGYTFEDLLLIK